MNIADLIGERVRGLFQRAAQVARVSGAGLVRRDGPEYLELIYADPLGIFGARVLETEILSGFRPRTGGPARVTAEELEANPTGLVESVVLRTGFSPEDLARYGARQTLTIPLRGDERSTMILVGCFDSEPLDAASLSALEAVAHEFPKSESRLAPAPDELDFMRRLEATARLLPALLRTLDVREIFDPLATMARGVLRHDFAAVSILSADRRHSKVYVQTSATAPTHPQGRPVPYPDSVTRAFRYVLFDDLDVHPFERHNESAKAGGKTAMRLAICHDDQVLGGVNFASNEPRRYDAYDLAIAQRIAEYIAITLSHHRLAEESRRNVELEARAAKSDLLDEVLGSLATSDDLPAVFDRISRLTQKVLAHDALMLPVRLPDGKHAKVYASSTAGGIAFPAEVDVPPSLVDNAEWEFEVVDDLRAAPDQQHLWTTKNGFRSTLRVPIRLDNEFVAGLSFLSFTPGLYSAADVPVARRIADRVALNFAPVRASVLLQRADEATARAARLEARVRALTEELDERTGYRRVIGDSKQWKDVLKQATQVAPTDTTVLLLGESGTGKEVAARFIHRASPRAGGPFIALNCAALPEQLLESELFGYEKGAYTGATSSKPGQLEMAAGGTLFLDEVAEMSLTVQAKFLRVLQEREFQRLGGTKVLKTDARIVAATNRDLQKAIAQGVFREDLYYRIHVFAIQLPALRERKQDVLALSDAFLSELGKRLGVPPGGISQDARELLTEYHWPGNVRELRNILERAAILCEGGLITPEHLAIRLAAPRAIAPPTPAPPVAGASRDDATAEARRGEATDGHAATATVAASAPPGDLHSMEKKMIEEALLAARFNKSKAAKALGLTRQQLYVRMKRHGIAE